MAGATDIEACERWFLRRGIPHFIDDYRATTDVFTRALPLLTLVFLVSVFGAGNLEWGWIANSAAIAGGFTLALGSWALVNRSRGRPPFQRPDDLGAVELSMFVLVPTVLQLVFGAQVGAALGTAVSLICVLVLVYVVTSYGLLPMSRWALGQSVDEVRAVLGLLVRALPLLLLVNAFLFINAEMWQVADGLNGATLAIIVVLFVALGTTFLLIRLPTEIDRAADAPPDGLLAGTPVNDAPVPASPALGRDERRNVVLVLLFSQGVQVLLVSVLTGVFFAVFGVVAIAPSVIEAWIGTSPDVLVDVELFGRTSVVTAELLVVSTFLASFSGLYFAVYVVTDATYREEFFDELIVEVRRSLAVRAVYLSALVRR